MFCASNGEVTELLSQLVKTHGEKAVSAEGTTAAWLQASRAQHWTTYPALNLLCSPLSQAPPTAPTTGWGSDSNPHSTANGLYLITRPRDVTYPRQLKHHSLLRTKPPLGRRSEQPGRQPIPCLQTRLPCSPATRGTSTSCLTNHDREIIVRGGYQLKASLPHREHGSFSISSSCCSKETGFLGIIFPSFSPFNVNILPQHFA